MMSREREGREMVCMHMVDFERQFSFIKSVY